MIYEPEDLPVICLVGHPPRGADRQEMWGLFGFVPYQISPYKFEARSSFGGRAFLFLQPEI